MAVQHNKRIFVAARAYFRNARFQRNRTCLVLFNGRFGGHGCASRRFLTFMR
jgi:hypothetical protein